MVAFDTANEWMADYLNLWIIKEGTNQPKCSLGTPITCGSTIRLEHTLTHKNLQSNSDYKSSLSRRQEISTFGYNGAGSENDDWIIECGNDDFLRTDTGILLRHKGTNVYLSVDKDNTYNEQNCQGFCPIKGNKEAFGSQSKKNSYFKIIGVTT